MKRRRSLLAGCVLVGATSTFALWYLNGTTYTGGTLLTAIPAVGWSVAAVGDYNGEGEAALLLQNATTRQAMVWYLRNGAFASVETLSVTPPGGWTIVGPR